MQYAAVLNIAARADLYRIDVAADSDQRPDADVIRQIDVADHDAGRIDQDALTEFGVY